MNENYEMNQTHREFARRLAAGGESASAIFRDLYPKSQFWKKATVNVKACLLAKRVSLLVKEIQKQATDATVMTILERKQTLTKIARGTVGDFVTAGADGVVVNVGPENVNSPALESVKSRCVTTGEGDGKQDAVVTEVKVRDPIAAIAELNKMEKVYTEGAGDQQLVIVLYESTWKPTGMKRVKEVEKKRLKA